MEKKILPIILILQIFVCKFEMRNITNSHEASNLQKFNLFKTFRRRVDETATISWLRPGVFRSDLRIFISYIMRNTSDQNENKKNSIVFDLITSPKGQELLHILAEQLILTESRFVDEDLNSLIIPGDLSKTDRKRLKHSKANLSEFFTKLEEFRHPLQQIYFSQKYGKDLLHG
jgi:hypothetical protein